MNNITAINQILLDHQVALVDTFRSHAPIYSIAQDIIECFENGNKVYIFGNGGSAADAQHVAAEFTNRFETERAPLAAIALTTDTSALTAIGNDYSFEEIFSKQIEALGQPEDIAIGISTSGTSKNVIRALEMAKKCQMKTILFSGDLSNITKDNDVDMIDMVFDVKSSVTARIQEIHILAWHIICHIVDQFYEVKKS